MTSNEDFMPNTEGVENEMSEQAVRSEDDMYEHYKFVVDKGQTQIRIDKFLTDRLSKISRNKIQNAIKVGSVLVDNQAVISILNSDLDEEDARLEMPQAAFFAQFFDKKNLNPYASLIETQLTPIK